jgi:hypothetical protein
MSTGEHHTGAPRVCHWPPCRYLSVVSEVVAYSLVRHALGLALLRPVEVTD